MKVISICIKCLGAGSIPAYKFLKKTCPVCKGTGKTTKHISDIKKEKRHTISLIGH